MKGCATGACPIARPRPRKSGADCGCGCEGRDPLALLGAGCSGRSPTSRPRGEVSRTETRPSGAPVPPALAGVFTAAQWASMSPAARAVWQRPTRTLPAGDAVPPGSGFSQADWDRLDPVTQGAWRQASTQGNAYTDYAQRVNQANARDDAREERIFGAVGHAVDGAVSTIETVIRTNAAQAMAESDARIRELSVRLASQTAAQAQETQRAIEAERTHQAAITAEANTALAHAQETQAQAALVAAQNQRPAEPPPATGPSTTTLVVGGVVVVGALGALAYFMKGN